MVNILSAKDNHLTLYPFLQLQHLAEGQAAAAESLCSLHLRKTVKTDLRNNIEYSGPIYINTAMVTLFQINRLQLHYHLRFSAYSTEIVTFFFCKNI
jgi:hypothetical protein